MCVDVALIASLSNIHAEIASTADGSREAEMAKNVHVVPHDDGWAVRREGASRVSCTYDTQAEAADAGRGTAREDHVEFFLHGRNGRIRERDSYGNDPFPPRDKD